MRLLLVNFVAQHTHLFQPLVMLENLSLQDHVQRMRRLKEWGGLKRSYRQRPLSLEKSCMSSLSHIPAHIMTGFDTNRTRLINLMLLQTFPAHNSH